LQSGLIFRQGGVVASGKAPSIALAPIENPDVGGVRFRKHPLEIEAGRLNQIAHRLGNRLLMWLRETEEQPEKPGMARRPKMTKLTRVVGRDMESGRLLEDPVVDKDGNEMLVPILPNEDFRDTFKLYERAVRNLLVEQRARAAMGVGKGGAPLDDATFKAGLDELVRETIKSMPIAELRELLKARAIDVEQQPPADVVVPADPNPPTFTVPRGTPIKIDLEPDVIPASKTDPDAFLPGLMGDDDDE
jgi:hypothetical protein